jgi:hypothetical protein
MIQLMILPLGAQLALSCRPKDDPSLVLLTMCSLDNLAFDLGPASTTPLSWNTRVHIALDAAHGMSTLDQPFTLVKTPSDFDVQKHEEDHGWCVVWLMLCCVVGILIVVNYELLIFFLFESRHKFIPSYIRFNSFAGLEYLHMACRPNIIHRDVKSSNILLTERMEAKISDFGLSKFALQAEGVSHISTLVKGTAGYLDPE